MIAILHSVFALLLSLFPLALAAAAFLPLLDLGALEDRR